MNNFKKQQLTDFNIIISARFRDSVNTISTYNSLFSKFINEFKHDIINATHIQLSEYILSMNSRSSMAQMYGVLKNYYTYVLKDADRLKYIPFPKKQFKLQNIPSHEQVMKMISVITNEKHKLILMMLYGTGMRCSELCMAKWVDLKRGNKISIKLHGKGKKDRIIYLSDNLYQQLVKYCKDYKLGCNTNPNHYIFGNALPYSKRSVANIVAKSGLLAKIPYHVSPHKIRHACFTWMAEQGIDLAKIQDVAGHECVTTTKIYAKYNPEHIDTPV